MWLFHLLVESLRTLFLLQEKLLLLNAGNVLRHLSVLARLLDNDQAGFLPR